MPNSNVNYSLITATLATAPAGQVTVLQSLLPDQTLLNLWGLYPSAEVATAVGTVLTFSYTLKMVPTIGDATGTANMNADVVRSVTTTGAGGLYQKPPVVTFTPPAGNVPLVAAEAFAQMQVGGTTVLLPGAAYTGATVATFSGGELAPGGVPAVAGAVTVVAGNVTAVAVATAGGPYVSPPICTITDTGGGTGAIAVCGLSVSGTVVTVGGKGYSAAPTVVYTPLFKQMMPDSGGNTNQAKTMGGWMKGIVQDATRLVWRETITIS